MEKHIKLVLSAYNPDFAIIGGMVVKLSGAQHGLTDPVLEVFENTKWAQEKEWTCYGPGFDENDEWVGQHVWFNALDDTQTVKVGAKEYSMQFVNSGQEKLRYPNSIENVNFYEFIVKVL